MKCPKCQSSELVAQNAGEVEIDRCPTCHGIWLDMLELETLLRTKPRELIESDQHFHAHPMEPGAQLTCPVCRGARLIKLNSRVRPGTMIDSCQVCFGTWLDAGELSRLSGDSLAQWVQSVFRG